MYEASPCRDVKTGRLKRQRERYRKPLKCHHNIGERRKKKNNGITNKKLLEKIKEKETL